MYDSMTHEQLVKVRDYHTGRVEAIMDARYTAKLHGASLQVAAYNEYLAAERKDIGEIDAAIERLEELHMTHDE